MRTNFLINGIFKTKQCMETGKNGDWKKTLRWQKLKLFCTDLTNLDLDCNDFFPMNCNTHANSILCARAYIFLSMKT